MNPTRYKQNKNEAKIAFVTRIVTSENRPMTASEVFACIDTEAMPDVVAQRIHANLSDAAGNYKMIGKKRMLSKQNEMRVHYFPLGMNVDGEEIPVPLYTKEGGNTFDNEDTPDAVKVAEKVLADLGAGAADQIVLRYDGDHGIALHDCTHRGRTLSRFYSAIAVPAERRDAKAPLQTPDRVP